MSNLQIFKTLDPLTNVNNTRAFECFVGGESVQYQTFKANGNADLNGNAFICNPPSKSTIISRKIMLNYKIQLVFQGTVAANTANRLLNSQFDGLRAFPLTSLMTNLQVQIGNAIITQKVADFSTALQRFSTNPFFQNCDLSTTPSMSDQYQSYSEGLGGSNNPLGADNANSTQEPRGFRTTSSGSSNAWCTIDANPNNTAGAGDNLTTLAAGGAGITPQIQQLAIATLAAGANNRFAVVTIDCTEFLMISPMLFGHGDESGLTNVESLQVKPEFSNNLYRLWSHDIAGAVNSQITSITGTALDASVRVKFVQPSATATRPETVVYPYSRVSAYTSPQGTVAAGAIKSNATSGSNTLDTVPTRMYVYARRSDTTQNVTTTDTFAAISNVSVQYGNRTVLSTASQTDLYQMAISNGSTQSWGEFSSTVGSICCFTFGHDIALPPDSCAGVLSRETLSVTVNFTNTSAAAVDYTLYVVVVSEGTMTIDRTNGVTTSIGVLTPIDVLNAAEMPSVPYSYNRNIWGSAYSGAGFFSDIVDGLKSGLKWGAENILPVVEKGVQIANALKGRGVVGAGLVGGMRVSRSALKQR